MMVRARFEASFLLAVIAIGCQVACMVVPVVVLWALAHAFTSPAGILIAGLFAIPGAVVAVIWLLGLVDRRYLVVRYGRRTLAEDEEDEWRRPGPLEAILPASVTIALIGLVVWLVVFAAHAPSGREQFIP
jgi:H+/gluconate symporter-like permease